MFPALFLAAFLQVPQVKATVETEPVPHDGDAADDLCLWVHPTDTSKSTIIGTDKKGGLLVYDLAGKAIQSLPDGKMNNVDLRYNFPLGDRKVALVTAGNRTDNSIAIYGVDPETRKLVNAASRRIVPDLGIYGSCMYRSPKNGKTYAFFTSHKGEIEQWELFDDGKGKVDGRRVRAFAFKSITEGCVADDELGFVYFAEEGRGIWKCGAEPGDETPQVLVDVVGKDGHVAKDIEGLAIYYGADKTGYLLASSQGRDEFVVYRREEKNDYLMTFKIGGVGDTDGIDVANVDLGPSFPKGVFVAQNGRNRRGHQNFVLVPWESIAAAGKLKIDTAWDPRR